jgi:RNA polymerase primary sigma factor
MPAQKSVKPVQSASKSDPKAKSVPASKTPVVKSKAQQLQEAADALLAAGTSTKKKPGRPPKAATEDSDTPVKTGAKRGRKPKGTAEPAVADDMDLSDIEADLVGEPATVTTATGEKVKPLRMKISKAKERALMKEFGLDETVLSEEDIAKRRQRLKALITAGQNPRLPDARRDFGPPARQAGRRRDPGSGDLHAQRHGRCRIRANTRTPRPCC